MSKIFPSMNSKPEKFTFFALIPCWIFVFFIIPINLPLLGAGLWDNVEFGPWLEIGYHVVNGIVLLFFIMNYLKDEWEMVTTDIRYYLKHVALTAGLMVGFTVLLLGTLFLYGFNIGYMLDGLPVVEMHVNFTSWYLVSLKPVFGTLAVSLFAPISVCVLFYCFAFAPLCYKRPWLGYLSIVVVTLIPAVINIIWRGEAALVLSAYIVRLPIHLLACWSYQKTDNVWTPMVSLMVTNLLLSVALLLLFG